MEPRDLIENGAHHRWPDGAISTLEVIEVCHLVLPTGRIAATDPAFDVRPDSELMLAEVPSGVYPVTLSIVNWASTPRFPAGLRRTTAAMVTVGNNPVVSWDRLEAGTGGSVLGVDAGTGCIYDASNRDVLEVLQADDERLDVVFVEVHRSGTSQSRHIPV